jgi:hypothetical protein
VTPSGWAPCAPPAFAHAGSTAVADANVSAVPRRMKSVLDARALGTARPLGAPRWLRDGNPALPLEFGAFRVRLFDGLGS